MTTTSCNAEHVINEVLMDVCAWRPALEIDRNIWDGVDFGTTRTTVPRVRLTVEDPECAIALYAFDGNGITTASAALSNMPAPAITALVRALLEADSPAEGN